MQLIIENFRGIKNAAVPLSDKITVFAGPTGSGKTSTIQTIQALMTGETVPLSKVKKKDAALLLHGKATKGMASLKHEDHCAEITWPSCKSKGMTFKCSKYAAGMLPPSEIEAKDLGKILNILPTKEEFDEEMEAAAHLNPPSEAIWEKIQGSDWDTAHKQAVEKGRDLKRDWERLSGRSFGTEIAANFTPDNYTGTPLDELQTALQSAEKLYSFAIKSETLGQKEQEDLKALAGQLDDSQAKISEANKEIGEVNAQLAKAQKLLEVIPKVVNQQQAYECWSCGKMGVIHAGKLIEAPDTEAAQADIEASQARLHDQREAIAVLQSTRDDLSMKLRELTTQLEKCKDAQKRLNTAVISEESPISVEDAAAEVQLCKQRITAHNIKVECDELYEALGINAYVGGVLHPDGLRKQVLVSKLQEFNELLDVITEIAGWKSIQLDEFMDISYDGLPYQLLSTGQQVAVNAVLQVAFTKMDGSQIVIIDNIQGIDDDMAKGLYEILDNIPIPSVLGLTTVNEEDAVLPVESVSYWCEGATIRPLKVAVMA